MASQQEKLEKLVKIDFVKFVDNVPIRSSIGEAALENLRNLNVGNNTVLVVGYPKSGSHFLLQILENLEYVRLYGKKSEEIVVDTTPIEFQTAEAIKWIEKEINDRKSERIALNHSHCFPCHLPVNKVKILFIKRDPRAVATSGYHFFGSMEKYKEMFDVYGIKDVNDFAKIFFEGKFSYGCIKAYNDAWEKVIAENKNILPLTFEDLKLNTKENVKKIANFLCIKEMDSEKVADGSQFEARDKYFANATDKPEDKPKDLVVSPNGDTSFLKRKGKIDSWKKELNEDALECYRNNFE